MSEHMTQWLGAYLDDELTNIQRLRLEAHLKNCQLCQTELQKLQELNALLQTYIPPETNTTANQFVAQVGLQLPPQQSEQTTCHKMAHFGWQSIPVLLFTGWVFIQTVLLVSGLLFTGLQAGLGGETISTWWQALGNQYDLQLFVSSTNIFNLTDFLWLFTNFILQRNVLLAFTFLSVLFSGLTGLLFSSWLASLWASYQHQTT